MVGRIDEIRPYLEWLDTKTPLPERLHQASRNRRLPAPAVGSGDYNPGDVSHAHSCQKLLLVVWLFREFISDCLIMKFPVLCADWTGVKARSDFIIRGPGVITLLDPDICSGGVSDPDPLPLVYYFPRGRALLQGEWK